MAETPVLFLEGDSEGRLIFGIPEHLREWKTLLPAREIWCGDEDCCSLSDIEDEVLTYYVVKMGKYLRVATRDRKLADDRDRLALEWARQTERYFGQTFQAMYNRRREESYKEPDTGAANGEGRDA